MSKAEFSECLFSLIGNSYYNRDQASLIFSRYDKDGDIRINYREFCTIIMPSDTIMANLLAGRGPVADRMTYETQDIFKRLLRAHLNLEQAHEYLRQRLHKLRKAEDWSLEELFRTIDREETGSISVYDLERLIMETKKG